MVRIIYLLLCVLHHNEKNSAKTKKSIKITNYINIIKDKNNTIINVIDEAKHLIKIDTQT